MYKEIYAQEHPPHAPLTDSKYFCLSAQNSLLLNSFAIQDKDTNPSWSRPPAGNLWSYSSWNRHACSKTPEKPSLLKICAIHSEQAARIKVSEMDACLSLQKITLYESSEKKTQNKDVAVVISTFAIICNTIYRACGLLSRNMVRKGTARPLSWKRSI